MFHYRMLLDMYIIDLFFYSFFIFFSTPNYMGRSYRLNSEKTFSRVFFAQNVFFEIADSYSAQGHFGETFFSKDDRSELMFPNCYVPVPHAVRYVYY